MKEIKRISAENEMLKYILEEVSGPSGRSSQNDPDGKPDKPDKIGKTGKPDKSGRLYKTDKTGKTGKIGSIGTEKLCMIIRNISEKAEFQGCVSHLCRVAGISRNTYYSYCRSKQ